MARSPRRHINVRLPEEIVDAAEVMAFDTNDTLTGIVERALYALLMAKGYLFKKEKK